MTDDSELARLLENLKSAVNAYHEAPRPRPERVPHVRVWLTVPADKADDFKARAARLRATNLRRRKPS